MSEPRENARHLGDLFTYLKEDTLRLLALAIAALPWGLALFVYDTRDPRSLVIWPVALTLMSVAGLVAVRFARRRYRLAVAALVVLPLLVDGILLYVLRDGQVLYFAVPLIPLASYLAGSRPAAGLCLATIVMGAAGVWIGLPLSGLVGPVALAIVNTVLSWLTSRHLYSTLVWVWENHQRSLVKAEEALRHRAELARTSKSLEEAYQRLRGVNEAFLHAWQAAEETKRFKSQFAANISHELRTPLHIIVGFCETMLFSPESYGPELPVAYRSELMEIYESSRHLTNLIDDILDFSQIEAGRMGISKEPTQLGQVIIEAVNLMRFLLEKKGLALEVTIPDDLPELNIDRVRIRQVIINLLNNAVRYTDHGSVAIAAEAQAKQVLVSVRDTGPGIPAEQLQKVFDGFHQVDVSASRRHGGAGLGLAISKHFIELHGGRIWVESQLNVGSRFVFSLPLIDSHDVQGRLRPQLIRGGPPMGHASDRVLLLHRDPATATMLERHLDGYRVLCVPDLPTAINQMSTLNPRAIVVDRALASELRQGTTSDQWTALAATGVPVIECPLPSASQPVFALGARAYLPKPISLERLVATLTTIAPTAQRVLVVDDEPKVVRLLVRMLQAAHKEYQVQRAFTGQEALDAIRTNRPDIVLLDLHMPDMGGLAVLDRMAHDPAMVDIPVVVISARDLPEDGIVRLQGPIILSPPTACRWPD